MQTRALQRNGGRAAVIAALVLLTAAILYLGWHSGNLNRAWSALRHIWEGEQPTDTVAPPSVRPPPPAVSDDAAWRSWMDHGKALSSGISRVIQRVPGAQAVATQALAAVDNAITGGGPHFGGSYGFHQTVSVVPDGGGWFDGGGGGGGGGCWGEDCGHHPDCHKTNSCTPPPDCHKTNTCRPPDCHDINTCPPPPDCHQTNTCPPPPDCHQTNTCPPPDCHQTNNCNPHPVDESDTLTLLGGAVIPLLLWIRRRQRKSPARTDTRSFWTDSGR